MNDQQAIDSLLIQNSQTQSQIEIHRQLLWHMGLYGCTWGAIFMAGQWAMLLIALKIMGAW